MGKSKSTVNHSFNRPAKCAAPPGKTYLTIGQDLFAIEGYLREQYNFSLHQYLSHKNNNSSSSSSSSLKE
jgi:hypothetical protein